MSNYYELKNIKELLSQGFSRNELHTLCFEKPAFMPVYTEWEAIGSNQDFVLKLVDYAYRQLLVEDLLDWAKENNPRRFDQCRPYLRAEQVEPLSSAPSKSLISGLCLPDNNLGRGISLGGTYRGLPLKIVATEWYEYGQGNWSRTGWLYVPQWTDNHATTFFKLHLPNQNTGYIHLLDAADPIHIIWLSTTAGSRIEKPFHYVAHPADVWDFKWEMD